MVTKKILVYWTHDRRVASLLRIIHRRRSADNQSLTSSTQEHPMEHAIGGSKILPPVLRQKAKKVETNIEIRDTLNDIEGELDTTIRYLSTQLDAHGRSVQPRVVKKFTGKNSQEVRKIFTRSSQANSRSCNAGRLADNDHK